MTTTDPGHPSAAPALVLPDVKMNLYRPSEPVRARCVRNTLCTSRKAAGFVRHVEFDVSGTLLEGAIRPGQAFGVIPPGQGGDGRGHKVRLYSVASPTRGDDPERPGAVISTTVKRTIDEHWDDHRLFLGVASNYLCDLQEGDEALLTGPSGRRFLLPENPGDFDYLFIATGTGIAPFRGMLIDLLEAGVRSQMTLLMGAAYATDLLYHDFLLGLQARHDNFNYVTALSRQAQGDPAGAPHDPMYVQGRLKTERDLFLPLLSSPRTLIYICGIAGMEVGIFRELATMLTGEALEQYLHVDPHALADVERWDRRTLRQVKHTERVFLEVYD